MDLGFSNVNQSAAVLENRSKNDGQWCSLELVGQLSNRDAIGSQIIFTTVADGKKRQYARWIAGGGSYMSQSAYTVQWACPPNEKLQQIEIKWPSGNQQLLPNMSINQSHVIVESLESVQ